jgi:hypothetical protein
VGAASVDCQIPLVADFGIFEMYPLEGEKEEEGRNGEDWSLSVLTGHSGVANLF